MHMNDGRVVSNFIIQAIQGKPITVCLENFEIFKYTLSYREFGIFEKSENKIRSNTFLIEMYVS